MGTVKTYASVEEGRHSDDLVRRQQLQEFVSLMLGPFIQKVYKSDHMIQILLEWLTGDFEIDAKVVFEDGALRKGKGNEIIVDRRKIKVIGKLNFDIEGFAAYSMKRRKELMGESADEMKEIVSP